MASRGGPYGFRLRTSLRRDSRKLAQHWLRIASEQSGGETIHRTICIQIFQRKGLQSFFVQGDDRVVATRQWASPRGARTDVLKIFEHLASERQRGFQRFLAFHSSEMKIRIAVSSSASTWPAEIAAAAW